VPKRLITAALLAAVLVGCGQGLAPTGPPTSSAAGDVAIGSSTPSVTPSAAPLATPSPTPAATPTPTPMPSPTPTPEPWQSFTSKKLRYSIKYPPDWVATPATPGYGDSLDDRGATFVFIDRDVVSAGSVAALERTAKAQIAYYKSHYDAKVLSNKKARVAGWNGRLIKMVGTEDGVETYYQLLLLAKGRVGYFLDWRSDDDDRDADKALFERMYKSFKPKS
jgi:PsbP-like protein